MSFVYHYYTFNFGPQHPATHGVLRLVVKLFGEIVLEVTPLLGFLHRGTEKLFEGKTLLQCLPYLDRLDYVSMMVNEHAFSVAVESLVGLDVPLRARYVRVLLLELTRLLNHLLAIGSCALDLGAMTALLWFFELREELLAFYEAISGSRMHANYIRPGGVRNDINANLLLQLHKFLPIFLKKLDDAELLLSANRIWRHRLQGVGVVDFSCALKLGFSGVMLRSAGIAWDIRKVFPYEVYDTLKFSIVCGSNGDCFDRYLMRMHEMRQSAFLIKQCIEKMPDGDIRNVKTQKSSLSRRSFKGSMNALIQHSKYCFENSVTSRGMSFAHTEAPKGELGVSLVLIDGDKPFRCHIRSPGFINVTSLGRLCRGISIADIIAVVGTLDIVFGEIDR